MLLHTTQSDINQGSHWYNNSPDDGHMAARNISSPSIDSTTLGGSRSVQQFYSTAVYPRPSPSNQQFCNCSILVMFPGTREQRKISPVPFFLFFFFLLLLLLLFLFLLLLFSFSFLLLLLFLLLLPLLLLLLFLFLFLLLLLLLLFLLLLLPASSSSSSSSSSIACFFFFFFFFFFFSFYSLYNPGCVSVCSTVLFHCCLSSTFALQPTIFILFRSSSTWSIHLNLLETELFFYFSTPVYKMWIIQHTCIQNVNNTGTK